MHSFNILFFFLYRKTIKILFPKEVAERQLDQETFPNYRSVMSGFDALHIKSTQRSSSSREVQRVQFSFSKIIFIVLSILGIAMVSAEIRFVMSTFICKWLFLYIDVSKHLNK